MRNENENCSWCPWVLAVLMLIASSLGVLAQDYVDGQEMISTRSCHHNIDMQELNAEYTATDVITEAALAIAPIGYVGKGLYIALNTVKVTRGAKLVYDAVYVAKTFVKSSGIILRMETQIGRVVLIEGGSKSGFIHILMRHLENFPMPKSGMKGEIFKHNPKEVLELLETTLTKGKYIKSTVPEMSHLTFVDYQGYRAVLKAKEGRDIVVTTFYPLK